MKLTRETRRALALISAGWFIHDAIWHFLMVAYSMTGIVTMEFSLPDFKALGIHPDRGVQAVAVLISITFALLLFYVARRLHIKG